MNPRVDGTTILPDEKYEQTGKSPEKRLKNFQLLYQFDDSRQCVLGFHAQTSARTV
jgi:hypothetical protein